MIQINYIDNEIQKDIKKQIEEIITILYLFFMDNKEDSKGIDIFYTKIKEIINKIDVFLEERKKKLIL